MASPAFAQSQTGATLQASKTLDICTVNDTTWRYSGVVSVWNQGATATQGLQILDHIQNKLSGPIWTDRYFPIVATNGLEVPAFTPEEQALVFPYSTDASPLPGDIRNVADVTILNHAGHITSPPTRFGPSPKATYTGTKPPPACAIPCGCTYTRGYWGSKPGVVWPAPYDRGALFYNSGLTWQTVLTTSAGGNGYYILGAQFIAATLNVANGACQPSGIKDLLAQAQSWFTSVSNPAAACPTASSCGLQKTWAGTLDTYNNGLYPGGPSHCGDEVVAPQ